MATHVVCLDGTHQTRGQPHPTNIALIFNALGGAVLDGGHGSYETTVDGPPALLGKYLPGVGTQGNPVLRVLGNAFGDGIAEPIVRGYTFLSRSYAPGDAIVITGFSRGATAARALAGFVAGHGLLNPATYDPANKDDAYMRAIAAWYDYRAPKAAVVEPQAPAADQKRRGLIEQKLGVAMPALAVGDVIEVAQIRAVGVFDTVSSLGLPHLNSSGDAVFDFTICDTNLSPKVANGFHALSADETRDLFAPTYWAARDGVEQVIFPGSHSNVGGGYPERGLSDGALAWMLGKLQGAGLVCNPPALNPNPLDVARDDGETFPFKFTPRRGRAFPHTAMAHASIGARWGNPADVLPGDERRPYRAAGTYADGSPIHP